MTDPISTGLGVAAWLLFGVTALVIAYLAKRGRHNPSLDAALARARDRLRSTKMAGFLGLRAGAEGRRVVAALTDTTRMAMADDVVLSLENDVQPSGCLLFVLPAAHALWVEEHPQLAKKVIDNAVQATLADAYVEINARRHPHAGRAHRNLVRDAAREAPRMTPIVRFLPMSGDTAGAVFAGSVMAAERAAKRAFGSSVPDAVRALDVPIVAFPDDDAAASPQLFHDLDAFLGAGDRTAPVTVSHTGAPPAAPTIAYAPGLSTQPYSPVRAVLNSGSVEATLLLRTGTPVLVGRGADNDVIVPDTDRSVSASHLVLTPRGSALEISAMGRTGTWLRDPALGRVERVPANATVALPVELILGDARSTVLRVDVTHPPKA